MKKKEYTIEIKENKKQQKNMMIILKQKKIQKLKFKLY